MFSMMPVSVSTLSRQNRLSPVTVSSPVESVSLKAVSLSTMTNGRLCGIRLSMSMSLMSIIILF